MRRALPLVLAAVVLLVPASAHAKVLLGAKAFAPNGWGFGTARPSRIFNGGDPSGSVRRIRWSNWGGRVARGHGLNPIFKPGGGYYATPARIDLRARGRGHCPGSSARAYTKLLARVPKRPGGKPGRWFPWSGSSTICSFELG